MGGIDFILVSDLHLGDVAASGRRRMAGDSWVTVERWFLKDLAAQIERLGLAPRLLLMTGDLTLYGRKDEFLEVDRFIERVERTLAARSLPPPLVFPVPGNHDLVRPSKEQDWKFDILRHYHNRDSQVVQSFIQATWERRERNFFGELFGPYEDWVSRSVQPRFDAASTARFRRSFFPGDVSAVLEGGDVRLLLVGLNSAWMQFTGGDFEGKLQLEESQYLAALADDARAAYEVLGEANAALLMMHHPLEWLSSAARGTFRGRIYPPDAFSACLVGHMHEARTEDTRSSGEAPRRYFQSRSLFGLEGWGDGRERPHVGYALGRIEAGGALTLWPRRLEADGRFERDQGLQGLDAGGAFVLVPKAPAAPPPAPPPPTRAPVVEVNLSGGLRQQSGSAGSWGGAGDPAPAGRPVRSGRPRPGDSEPAAPQPQRITEPARNSALLAYRKWALDTHTRLRLLGLGAGDFDFGLDEIYVPLRLCTRVNAGRARRAAEIGREELRDLETRLLFAEAKGRTVVLLGDPGAGKTTALKKLLQLALEDDHRESGLPRDTLPIFVPLRRIKAAEELAGPDPLGRLVAAELGAVGDLALSRDQVERLWAQTGLLLLDGLDEIPDDRLRGHVLRAIEAEASALRARGTHIAVSSRYARLVKGVVEPGPETLLVEVRPLDRPLTRKLVERWFLAARHQQAREGEEHERILARADAEAQKLIQALEDPGLMTEGLLGTISTPLLLTLLCVVTFRGHPMPERRAAFYRECIEVLVERRSTEKDNKPLLPREVAVGILRDVASALHEDGRKDDLSPEELRALAAPRLARLRKQQAVTTPQVLRWLHEEVGILTEFADDRFGFSHLAFQEFLAAEAIAIAKGRLLESLAARFGVKWWREVTRLCLGHETYETFGDFMGALIRGDRFVQEAELFEACLDEAHETSIAPFEALLLDRKAPIEKRRLIMRSFAQRGEARVAELAVALARAGERDPEILSHAQAAALEQGHAARRALEAEGTVTAGGGVFLGYHEADRPAVRRLAAELGRRGVNYWLDAERLEQGSPWNPERVRAIAAASVVAVCLGPSGIGPWEAEEMHGALLEVVSRGLRVIPVILPEVAGMPQLPIFLRTRTWVDLREDLEAGLERLVWGLRAVGERGPAGRSGPAPGEPWEEPETGMRFLYVPGGRFTMGSEEFHNARPLQQVEVSPFWLAETPTTNAQYAAFMKATGTDEPPWFRGPQFGDPRQPVVGVTWGEAAAFCQWLAERHRAPFRLPTEAEWELAARSTDGRLYPWGDTELNARLARYLSDRPAPVGSHPEGRGPFGHLDLAGNVWEWCHDPWDRTYDWSPAKDPVVRDDKAVRSCRGGGWGSSALDLRPALRLGRHALGRLQYLGFRVLSFPTSTLVDS